MSDDIGFSTKLDRLAPTEKAGDYKGGPNPYELRRKKRGKQEEGTLTVEGEQEKEGNLDDSSVGDHPGKIVDMII